MPWNGSGSFSRDNGTNTGLTVWEDDFNAGTAIRADNHDTHDQDIADGVEACLAKNGENAMTGALNMGGQKATNAAVGTAASDLPTLAQVQANTISYAADGGAANAYTVSLSPAATAYTAGMQVCFKVANTNTGASTINVNALGVKNIFVDGAAVTGGELMAGDMVELRYDGTQFQVVSFPRRKRISGPASSLNGPHLTFNIDGDAHAPFQILPFTHDNIQLLFDSYWDGVSSKSSDVGSNFQIVKQSDKIIFNVDSGVAVGSTISWTNILTMDTSGNVSLPNDSNGATTNMLKIGAGEDLQLFHTGTNSYVDHTYAPGILHIRATGANGDVRISAGNSGGTLKECVRFTADDIYHRVQGSTVTTTSSGTFSIQGNLRTTSGSVGSPPHSFTSDTATGGYLSGTNSYAIAAGGVAAAAFGATASKIVSGYLTVGPALEMVLDSTGHPTLTANKASSDLIIQNARAGREVFLRGTTTGSVLKNIFFGDPDGYSQMYYSGTWMGRADATGWICNGQCEPQTDNAHDVGSLSFRWDDVYATNGTIQTSDARLKTDIAKMTLGGEFVDSLNPVHFRWLTGKRRHNGLVAQEVELVLQKFGIATNDFAGFIKGEINDREGSALGDRLGLRMEEFVPILMKNLQENNEKIRALEGRNAALEARLAAIELKLTL